ncbi:hypothetical protein K435DRAFT_786607 [Dendrothele bispora CBS 962.96]|uniref:Uncharacterized protein n=1 Tax=Dendrothele bispora (strain CBS 962.96) TaxID=1314807 RepID=A0A4S8KPU9_DENBC|nr:hypothetical protein K435DRAFT_786607 [Dendrothele bispora CBS 962.96]
MRRSGHKLNNGAVPWLSPAPKLFVKCSNEYSSRLTSLEADMPFQTWSEQGIDPFPDFH